MANIERRISASGEITYRVRVRLKGARSDYATFRRITDARKWAQKTEAAVRENRHFKNAEARRHTLGDVVERFIANELTRLPKVEKLLATQLRWWGNRLGHRTLADLTAAAIAEQRDYLAKHGTRRAKRISPATVNRYLAALSIALNVACKEWGWLEDVPTRKVKKLKESQPRVRFLSAEERTRLLDACKASKNPFLYSIVVVALSTGARKMELLPRTWDDVDLSRGMIYLEETKNGERRALPLRGLALTTMRQLSKSRSEDIPLVFPSSKDSSKPIVIEHPWQQALVDAKLNDFRFHDLRHSTASYLAMNGASLTEIAEILGHRTLQMVKRYAHLSEGHTAKVVASMNAKIFGTRP